MKRFVDYDPLNGITTSVDYNSSTDTTNIITEYSDATPILDMNKARQNDSDYTKKGIKDGWWHYAFIPNSIISKWMIEEKINVFDKNDNKKVFQKINSPEYKYLKTTTKHHTPRP